MKKASGRMKLDWAQYGELESFAQFASDLDPETKKVLDRGRRITELLKQSNNKPLRVGVQVALFYAVNNGYLDNIKIENIRKWEDEVISLLSSSEEGLVLSIEKDWNGEIEQELKEFLDNFNMSIKG